MFKKPSLQIYTETCDLFVIHMDKINLEERVSLKSLSRMDLDSFYSWVSDVEVAKTMTWEAYNSRSDAENFLINVVENHPWFKAICFDGLPVGSITLNQGKGNSSCRAEIGYVLAKAYWGKNIATIAVKKTLKTGFSDLNIQRIEAFVDPDNIASQRVLIKSGMTCEGLLKNYTLFKGSLRDSYLYSATN